jgi:hypothetical protein
MDRYQKYISVAANPQCKIVLKATGATYTSQHKS